jgi:crossover junction endodeoxyribonuclease RusA
MLSSDIKAVLNPDHGQILSITVYGKSEPQGSTKAFMPKGWTRPVITTDNAALKPWRQQISWTAAGQLAGQKPTSQAVSVAMRFYFARPKSLPKKIIHKTTKSDVDKLARGVLDALSGIAFVDDSQVISLSATKQFGLPERVEIEVSL